MSRVIHRQLLGTIFLATMACGQPMVEAVIEAHVEGVELLPPVDCDSSVNPNVDFLAKTSGPWSSPATWGGVVPNRNNAGSRLDMVICKDVTVTFDTETINGTIAGMTAGQYVDTLRLQGTLDFHPNMNTRLFVDTLVSEPGGVLQVGTPAKPIAPGNKAEILIPTGPFAADDIMQMGKGLILNGPVRMFGASKTSFASITSGYTQGSDRISIDVPNPAWVVGDEIVIAPTAFEKAQDVDPLTSECSAERFRIFGFANGAILLGTPDTATPSPATLAWNHTPYPGQKVHVANLTRNVVVRSVSTSVNPPRRGHVMITRGKAQVHNVELRQMGRTDKTRFLDDAVGTTAGTNQRGRYPLHFHRTIESGAPEPSSVTGSIVNGSPGWGFVNHSSDVQFIDSVSYDVDGAGFVAEASDERGSFDHNIAICGDGDPDFHRYAPRRFEGLFEESEMTADNANEYRTLHGDLAFTGDGFWVQSPLVQVTNNIATGLQGHAFILWNQGLFETRNVAGVEVEMVVGPRVEDLPPCPTNDCYRTFDDAPNTPGYGVRALANDIPVAKFEDNPSCPAFGTSTACPSFKNNVAYASFMGFMVRFSNHPNITPMKDSEIAHVSPRVGDYWPGTTLENSVAWNDFFGFGLSYALNLKIDGAQILTNQDLDALNMGLDIWAINADSNLCDSAAMSTPQFIDLVIQGYKSRNVNYDPDCLP